MFQSRMACMTAAALAACLTAATFAGEGPKGIRCAVFTGKSTESSAGPSADGASAVRDFLIANSQLGWRLDWSEGRLRSRQFENKLAGRSWALGEGDELALTFSAAVDRIEKPLLRVADFAVRSVRPIDSGHAVVELRGRSLPVDVTVHYQIDGPTRRKWIEVTNRVDKDILLLDVQLDDLAVQSDSANAAPLPKGDGTVAISGGGRGQPVFVGGEWFAAVEHPAGVNQFEKGRVRLMHHPARRLGPNETFRSQVALVSVAERGQAAGHFVSYIESRRPRPRRVAVYTPFGINNQWGGCPTLDEEQTLDVLNLLERWQRKGVRFDYFTLDTGWADPGSDLTRFNPLAFPDGPERVIRRVKSLGMKFGLWFATSWAAETCWDYPPALGGQRPLAMGYRLGYPNRAAEPSHFCFAAEPYYSTLRNAVLYHIRHNGVRLVKFDGSKCGCDVPGHGHLPGKYSVEFMHQRLIDLANAARGAAPDVIVVWYWGLRSPFWALYGDTIFESGLPMEGSATSGFPSLYYRDSVTIALDQGTQFASTLPPLVKDSLGVWLADNRWGNYMGNERWREAMVMDLGRGGLFFPNLWGDLYRFDDADVDFLARISSLSRAAEPMFRHRLNILGDPLRNEVYGYADGQGGRGFVFLNNAHFAAREARLRLDARAGLQLPPGRPVDIISHFPDRNRLLKPNGSGFRTGEICPIWLRPFEVLMLEVAARPQTIDPREPQLPVRAIGREQAAAMGVALRLRPSPADPALDVRFSDAARFQQQKLVKKTYTFQSELPAAMGNNPVLAVVVRLRRGGQEWRGRPVVCEIVQPRLRVGERHLPLAPVPDGRQFGSTQSFGCSWVVYKTRLSPRLAAQPVRLAVHACLPESVEAAIEGWLLDRWWQEDARPSPDGYYNDAPT